MPSSSKTCSFKIYGPITTKLLEGHKISEILNSYKCGICQLGTSMLNLWGTQKEASAQKVCGEGTGDLGHQSVAMPTSLVPRLRKDLL